MDPRMILMLLGFGAGICWFLIGIMFLLMKPAKKARISQEDDDDSFDFDDMPDDPFTPQPEEPAVAAKPFEAPQVEPATFSVTPETGAVLCNALPYLQKIFSIFTTTDFDKFNDIEVQDLAQSHANIAQNYLNSGVRRHTELVSINSQQDLLHEKAHKWEYVTSEVQATVRDCITDLATGKVAGGDETSTYNVKYILIFARPLGEPSFALMKANLVQ